MYTNPTHRAGAAARPRRPCCWQVLGERLEGVSRFLGASYPNLSITSIARFRSLSA